MSIVSRGQPGSGKKGVMLFVPPDRVRMRCAYCGYVIWGNPRYECFCPRCGNPTMVRVPAVTARLVVKKEDK